MVTEINHDAFCFNAQRVTRLELDSRVAAAVYAQAVLDRMAQWKAAAQPRLPESDFLRTGRLEVASYTGDIRRAVEHALTSGTSVSTLPKVLDRLLDRYRSDSDARASEIGLKAESAPGQANPYDSEATRTAIIDRLTEIRELAITGKEESEAEAVRQLDSFNRLAAAIGPRIAAVTAAPAQRRWRWLENHWPLWLAPVGAVAGPALIGQDAWSLALATLFGAVVGITYDWLRHRRPKPEQPNDTTHRIARPATDLLSAYLNAAETGYRHGVEAKRAATLIQDLRNNVETKLSGIEDELAAQFAALPSAAFLEIHPGRVLLTGAVIARTIVAGYRDRLERIPASAAESASALIGAAAQALGPVTLAQSVGAFASDPELRFQLEFHLKQNLEPLARTVITVRSDVSIDRSLCPDFLSIGLPDGDQDALVPFIRRTFPGASIVSGSAADAIEIIYRVHNLSREHFAIHTRSANAYNNATNLERRLWHFPRRVAALTGPKSNGSRLQNRPIDGEGSNRVIDTQYPNALGEVGPRALPRQETSVG